MMTFVAAVLTFIGLIVLAMVLLVARLFTRRQESPPAMEEALTVQEMYRTLDRLEKRMDVLETLLADRVSPEKNL